MALIDRAITGAKARLETAERCLRESTGNADTIAKKQRQVDVCRITLQALEEKRDRDHAKE
jgi:hypothetical protein